VEDDTPASLVWPALQPPGVAVRELLDALEARGPDLVGFYHSHPAGPPAPSATDVARATWPGLSYVIVVLDGRHPYVGSWRWNAEAGTFDQEVVALR
jgi:proteasome lid subunit RPN8/RPN11